MTFETDYANFLADIKSGKLKEHEIAEENFMKFLVKLSKSPSSFLRQNGKKIALVFGSKIDGEASGNFLKITELKGRLNNFIFFYREMEYIFNVEKYELFEGKRTRFSEEANLIFLDGEEFVDAEFQNILKNNFILHKNKIYNRTVAFKLSGDILKIFSYYNNRDCDMYIKLRLYKIMKGKDIKYVRKVFMNNKFKLT